MIELSWADKRSLNSIVSDLQRAYFDSVYRVTRAALEPVVAAISDAVRDAVTEAVRDGIDDAIPPMGVIGDFIFGRRGK